PLFFRRGSPLAIQAPVRALEALMKLAGSNWELSQVLDLLASPYLDLGLEVPWTRTAHICALAGVTDERAGGGFEPNLERLSAAKPEYRQEIKAILEALARLKKLVSPLARPQTWSGFASASKKLLQELRLKDKVREGEFMFLHRDAAAWAGLEELLNDLAEAEAEAGLSEEVQSLERLRGLRTALKDRNLQDSGLAAAGIMVLSIFDLHGLDFDYLFLAGLNEGEFPWPEPEGLLSDAQKKGLNQAAGRRALLTSSMNYRQQELMFYHALASAGKGVVLSYSREDESGRLRLPSALVDEVLGLWGENAPAIEEIPARLPPTLESVLTAEELYGHLAFSLLRPSPSPAASLSSRVLGLLLEREPSKMRWESLSQRARLAQDRLESGEAHTGRINPVCLQPWLATLRRHQDEPLLSPTFLQEYAACPFAFWARQIIGAEPAAEAADEIKPVDEGSILHEILSRFMKKCHQKRRLPLSGRPQEIKTLHETAESVFDEEEKQRPLGRRPLWEARRRFILRTLDLWLKREQVQDQDFQPRYFEWEFGPGEGGTKTAPVLTVPLLSGGNLHFRGRVDRIDLSSTEARVFDYKYSSNTVKYSRLLKEEELGRTSFQAPVYQAAVNSALGLPARAAWILLTDYKWNKSTLKYTRDTSQDLFDRDLKNRRKMQAEGRSNFFNLLEGAWQGLINGSFSPSSEAEACEYCDYRTVCRLVPGLEETE
ncbi:MAG: PD-(D/E)XK nuclease family protein, partial [Pseudomonadota bacterium]